MSVHSDHYALVVGIDDYPDFSPLNGAKNDAIAFEKWLLDVNTGGGVPKKNRELVLSTPDPVEPIQDTIDDALKRLLDRAKAADAQRLYIYFSGHGVAHTSFSTNLCLAKWSKRRSGAALDSMNYLECAKETGIFKQIILLMDCCRTKTRGRNALNYQFPPISPGAGASGSRIFLGHATEFMLAAHEAAVTNETELLDEEENGEEVRGHFTRALIEALQGRAAQESGGVTAAALKDYLDDRTVEIAQEAQHDQRPEVINGLPSTSDSVFGSALPTTATSTSIKVEISFGTNRQGAMAFEDGEMNIIKEGPGSTGPWLIENLSRGLFAVVDKTNDEFQDLRITGNEQEVIHVQFD